MSEAKVFPFNGILLVDKPSGMTSHDVVARLRRRLQMKRIGHAGTLDPMATGLMILLLGRATKASDALMGLDKAYEARLKLGEVTDSYDADGQIIETRPIPGDLTREQVEAVVASFQGVQLQTPPMFSAKKVDGVALYKLARKGQTIERKAREITVSRIELMDFALPEITFRLDCTKGTYVRTVGYDIGEKLGCGGHLTALRRTRIGAYALEQALTLEAIQELDDDALRSHLLEAPLKEQ